MRVLLTRDAGSWPGLVARLARQGIEVETVPTTRSAEPLDPAEGEAALERLSDYSWIVLTSGRGVTALASKLAKRGSALPRARFAAVGPATARALEGLGARVEIVADDPRGEGLARRLAPRLGARDRVLLVRPEAEQEGELAARLAGTGARVDEAPLYRTVASAVAEGLAAEAIAGRFDAVVFAAPSALRLWLQAAGERSERLREALAKARRVAIGPTTAAALAAEGLPAHERSIAPDEAGIGDAILRAAANMPPFRGDAP